MPSKVAGSARFGAEELLWPQVDLVCPAVPLAEIFSGVDPIYHLSWSTIPADSILSLSEDARINITGFVRLIEMILLGSSMARPPLRPGSAVLWSPRRCGTRLLPAAREHHGVGIGPDHATIAR
jgi:hypothetical protein